MIYRPDEEERVQNLAHSSGYALSSAMYYSACARWPMLPDLARVIACFTHLIGNYPYSHLPFFLVHDLYRLLDLGTQFPFAALTAYETWSAEEKRGRLHYANWLFGQVLASEPVQSFRPILGQGEARHKRLCRMLEIFLAPLAEYLPPTSYLDPWEWLGQADHGGAKFGGAVESPVVEEPSPALRRTFFQLLAIFPQLPSWAKVFAPYAREEIAGIDFFDSLARRLEADQIRHLLRKIPPAMPLRLPLAPELPETSTNLEDWQTYPEGGFSEITNHGSLENLVLSELIYLEKGQIDLFTLRWLESELLFYLRESGQLWRRQQRLVLAAICDDFDRPYLLHPPVEMRNLQYWIYVAAFFLRLIEDLFSFLDPSNFAVSLCLVVEPGQTRGQEILTRLLQAKEEKRMVAVLCLQNLLQLQQVSGDRAIILSSSDKIQPLRSTDGPARWWKKKLLVGFNGSSSGLPDGSVGDGEICLTLGEYPEAALAKARDQCLRYALGDWPWERKEAR